MSGTALSDVDFSPKINYPDAEVRDLTWQDAEEALRYATELLTAVEVALVHLRGDHHPVMGE